ncbi:MAG: aldehyde ferredoxin oxidoreductase C-terminal domain-containing protein [Actinomycetia bacterium]|nr:aldehyde ferredoxin oxidoreductase C-terminal domain-containing protein [Actinomycetes bacterium]
MVRHRLGYALSNRGACHINGRGLVYLEAMGDAWATLGLCMFLMFGLLPAGESALSPHGSIARLTSKLTLASGP